MTAPLDIDAKAKLIRRATSASVAVAGVLIGIKTAAWIATDSVAILASLVDSVLDAVASVVNLLAVRHALTPADREHRFGHGKAEFIAGLGQAALVAGSALFLLVESIPRLIHPQPVAYGNAGVAVILVSIALTWGLVRFQAIVVERTGSTAVDADSLHYRADLMVNAAIVAALLLATHVDAAWVDPLVAAAIAVYILRSAWTIARTALDGLMDRELPDSDRRRIVDIVAAHAEVKGVHDLRTRRAGLQPFIQFHIELEGSMTLFDAHIVSDRVEADVVAAFPGAEVIIHQDPEGIAESMPDYARS